MDNNSFNKQALDDGVNIKKLLYLMITRWYLFAVFVPACYFCSYMVNRYSVSLYEISSSVLIREKGSVQGSVESVMSEMGIGSRRRQKKEVENEIGLIKSYTMIRKAINKLNFDITYVGVGDLKESELYGAQCPFYVIADTLNHGIVAQKFNISIRDSGSYRLYTDIADLDTVLKFDEWFNDSENSFKLILNKKIFNSNTPNGSYDNGFWFSPVNKNALTNLYRSKLSIMPIEEKATMLTLTVVGAVPEKESDFLNTLCDVYIQSELDVKNRASENTIRFIDSQLKQTVDSLVKVEGSLQSFRVSNQSIVDVSAEGLRLLQKMEVLESEKALITVKMKYIDYLVNYANQKESLEDILAPSIMEIGDPMMTQLISQMNEAYLQRSEIVYSSRENSPSLNLINNKIEELQQRLIETLHSSKESFKLTANDLRTRIDIVQHQINKLPATERRLINIRRKFEINDDIYTFLLQKRAEAGISRASNTADNLIVDTALPENATLVFPKKSKNTLIGIFIGFLVPILFILLKGFFNNKVMEKADVDQASQIPVLSTIGHVENSMDNQVISNSRSFIAENFRTMKANLQFISRGIDKSTITVTSTVSGEGKTFIAVNLASVFALARKKTLLVGLDMRKPRVHKVFDISNSLGLSTYLINKNTVDEIIQKTDISNLDIVSSGPIPPNPAELIESERMHEFFEIVKQEYDYIILDTPPVALVSDTFHIMKYSDTNLFVVRHNYTRKEMIGIINEMHEKAKINNMSIVINDLRAKSIKGGYRYNYGYGYGYGYEYGGGYGYGNEDNMRKKWLRRIFKREKK